MFLSLCLSSLRTNYPHSFSVSVADMKAYLLTYESSPPSHMSPACVATFVALPVGPVAGVDGAACAQGSRGAPGKHRLPSPGPRDSLLWGGAQEFAFLSCFQVMVPGLQLMEPACSIFPLICFWPKSLPSGATSNTCSLTPALPHSP